MSAEGLDRSGPKSLGRGLVLLWRLTGQASVGMMAHMQPWKYSGRNKGPESAMAYKYANNVGVIPGFGRQYHLNLFGEALKAQSTGLEDVPMSVLNSARQQAGRLSMSSLSDFLEGQAVNPPWSIDRHLVLTVAPCFWLFEVGWI